MDNAAANVKQSAKQAAEAAQGSSGESASRGADALSTATPTPSGSTPGILEESAKSLTDGQPQPGPSPGGSNSLLDSFNDAKSSLQEGGNTLLSSTGDSVQGERDPSAESIDQQYRHQVAPSNSVSSLLLVTQHLILQIQCRLDRRTQRASK